MMRFAGIFGHTKTKFTLLANEFGKEKREDALHEFAEGKIKLLLATDLAARGLDIPDVTYVINFDIPNEVNTYLHRQVELAGWVLKVTWLLWVMTMISVI